MSRRTIAFSLAAPAATAAHADTTGRATLIDGDTLDIRGERIRVDAIDAPDSGQTCEADGEPWRCRQQAALALADKIGAGGGRGSYGGSLAAMTSGYVKTRLNRGGEPVTAER